MNKVIPLLKYPTTTVFVDDSHDLLNELKLTFKNNKYCRYFQDAFKANDFISKNNTRIQLEDKLIELVSPLNSDEKRLSIKLDLIKNEYNNTLKNKRISVLVTDYEMPLLNGLSLCKLVKDEFIYKILLTGIAEDKLIIDAFHNGIIDAYISKTSNNFLDELQQQLQIGQNKYFSSITTLVNKVISIDTENNSYLNTQQFKSFFEEFLRVHAIDEYYLIDPIGSFFIKTKLGEYGKLYIADDVSFQFMIEQLPDDIENSILSEIKNRNRMYCFREIEDNNASILIEKHIYPCFRIKGEHNLYYTYLKQAN